MSDARLYVLGRFAREPEPDPGFGDHPVQLLEFDEVTHAVRLSLTDPAPGPVCGATGFGFTTLAPGFKGPLGPDEARLLVGCSRCRSRIEPARPDREAQLERALRLLKTGDCWCEMGIDHPMWKDHSEGCKLTRRLLREKP